MDRAETEGVVAGAKSGRPRPRRDVEALLALVALDEGIAKAEAAAARTLALVERTTAELAEREREVGAKRGELRRREESGAAAEDLEGLRRSLREAERHATQVMRLADKKQGEAVAASAGLREAFADLPVRRKAIVDRIPGEALEIYEDALRRGLLPPAVATRGTVCWGCFHQLSRPAVAAFLDEEAYLCCPHCERLLFNPEWTERR